MFLKSLYAFALLLSVLCFPFAPVQAEEEALQSKMSEEDPGDKIYKMVMALILSKSQAEQKHFFMAYTNYNLIQTVKTVQSHVGNAIDECSETNPDMENNLRARYGQWNDAVNPVINDAEIHLNNMILAQEYASPEEIQEIFAQVDTTREQTQSEIEKIPVTTPEACTYLLEKMDETQDNMISLLKNALLSFSQVFPDAETDDLDVDSLELDALEN